ncbi:LysR family transcriptional regulator [Aestuariirhabdus sp. LZHN29]|uniref:LysR family transcriptional regulator n=1 Tax=Aestuariirhabdus sp. LZHN29 TaxID=3417462 RepID=UPI003CF20D71
MPQNRHFDLNLLRAFSAVYRTASFTRAAEQLDLTQSSVSNAIHRLKRQIGEDLFVRAGRGIQPTVAAHQLHAMLENSLLDIDRVIQGFEHFDPKQSERAFQVYAMEPLIHLLQPLLDRELRGLRSRIVFRDLPPQEDQIQEHLLNNQVDLVLDFIPPQQAELSCSLLLHQHICCVVRQGHPRIRGQINADQYYQEMHVLLTLRRHSLTVADILTREVLRPRSIYCEHNSLVSMLATVGRSDAIGVSSTSLAQQYQQAFELQILPLPFSADPVPIYLVWATRLHNHPAQQWLRMTLERVAAKIECSPS